jgi:dihydroorotase-like cyclic amidohydrolase
VLDADAVRRNGGLAKVAPPLRERGDADALWQALADGTLTLVASDHSPFLAHEKAEVPFAVAPQGLPTVELLVPVVLDAAVRGRLPLEVAVGYLTSAPAKLFGLHPRKGALAVGSDADIALVDLDRTYSPRPDTVFTRAAGCAIVFAGMTFGARVQMTLVNGTVVYDDGHLVAEHAGRFTAGGTAILERA